MRLRRLKLRNFRGFGSANDTIIDLDHSAVVLVGKNGTGKSSIFDALELLLTGSIRRLKTYGNPAPFLVNVRNPNNKAELLLEWTLDGNNYSAAADISGKARSATVSPVLNARERHLLLHTAYLLQSDIRRLVSATSLTLGEIVKGLVVDEQLESLFRGLSDAAISRNDQSYQRVKHVFDQLGESLNQLDRKIQDRIETIRSIQSARVSLDRLAGAVATVGRAVGLKLSLSSLVTASEILDQTRQLDKLLHDQLTKTLEDINHSKRALEDTKALEEDAVNLGELRTRIGQNESASAEIRQRAEQSVQQLRDVGKALSELDSALTLRKDVPTLIGILSIAVNFLESDVCPLCDRPFPNLRDHVERKLLSLQEEQTEIEKRASEVQRAVDSQKVDQADANRVLQSLERENANLQEEAKSLQKKKDEFLSRYRELVQEKASLSRVRDYEENRLAQLSGKHVELSRLVETTSQVQAEILAATTGLAQMEEELKAWMKRRDLFRKKIGAARDSIGKLDTFIDMTHETRRQLSDSRERLLNEFIRGHANDVFVDLFGRIVRHPYFQVSFRRAQVRYHKPEVAWEATYEGQHYTGETVLSQGQLNACALALFLALASTQPTHLGFLLLDDPVQSMDEVHIEEFANILKSLKDTLGWQIIVSVHEESLANYLKRQLYPSSKGQSLIVQRLIHTSEGPVLETDEKYTFDQKDYLTVPSTSVA